MNQALVSVSASSWASLRAAGLVSGEMPASDGAPPWYVRVMMGGSAWLGSLFLFGFVVGVLHFVLQSPTGSLAAGGIACAAAYAIFRNAGNSDAMSQFGLATTFLGQTLVGVGLFTNRALPPSLVWPLFAAFQVLLAAALPNLISRYAATLAALFGITMAASIAGLQPLVPAAIAALCAAIWMNEFRWGWRADAWRAIGFGVASYLLLLEGTRLGGQALGAAFSRSLSGSLFGKGIAAALPWLGNALVGLVLVGTVMALLLRQPRPPGMKASALAVLGAVLLAALGFKAPGLVESVLLVILGYMHANRVLVGIGLLALGGFLSHYYYQMQETLLNKSMLLALTGAGLIGARLAVLALLGPAPREPAPHEPEDVPTVVEENHA